ncbi:MAG: hypothetical protein IPO71_14415 [Nitrosomonas sp.]|nr:hypothetical protein [Nitrosomonas sp.]
MANSIGRFLIKEGFISDAQLVQARINQKQNSGKLEDSLVSLGFLSSEQVQKILHPIPSIPITISNTGLSEAFLIDLLKLHTKKQALLPCFKSRINYVFHLAL